MSRTIISIDQSACTGCGLCVAACHEGAIAMVNGKAQLTRSDYCDGLGDCLPACPAGAISFITAPEVSPAAADAVASASAATAAADAPVTTAPAFATPSATASPAPASQLAQWPCQIRLAPTRAPYFDNCHLLIAADCTAFAYANFHQDFMAGCVTLVGCPKLDPVDYSEKLTAIISSNSIRAITLARMEVPCCGGLEMALRSALAASGKAIPLSVTVMGIKGDIQAIR